MCFVQWTVGHFTVIAALKVKPNDFFFLLQRFVHPSRAINELIYSHKSGLDGAFFNFFPFLSASCWMFTPIPSIQSKMQGNGDICIPVFMRASELERLREGKAPVIEITEDAKSQLPEVMEFVHYLVFVRFLSCWKPPTCWNSQTYFAKSKQGEFVGLYILSLAKIAIAVLMNLPALYDERHINKTVRKFSFIFFFLPPFLFLPLTDVPFVFCLQRLMAQSRLHNLELKLHKMPKISVLAPCFPW